MTANENLTLTADDLSRATLARQLLLERVRLTPAQALERLLAIQAQWPKPAFFALFARLAGFQRDDLMRLVRKNAIVRGTSFRGTIFLQLAKDFARFRSAVLPTLERAVVSMVSKKIAAKDYDAIVARGRAFFAAEPRTFDELRTAFAAETKEKDAVRLMALLVRLRVPLIQVATDVPWGWHAACDFAVADTLIGERFDRHADLEALVVRYLAALGPATVADAQTFTGVTGLKPVFEQLRPKLVTFRDDRKQELFDLPAAPRPGPDALPDDRVHVRFLPDFDNVTIGHADRRRFVAEEHRKLVYLPGLVVARTFLVGGHVAGTWSIVSEKKTSTLVVEPFSALTKKTKAAIEEEGDPLVRFAGPEASKHDLRFDKPRS